MASGRDAEPVNMEPVNANSFEVEPAPAVTAAPQPQQEGVARPVDAAAVPVPWPPYTEDDDIIQGVRCYWPDCAVECKCWGKLLVHCLNLHPFKTKSINGTYFHKMGNAVLPQTISAL